MKEIRVARKALLAYLIISALVMSVTRKGDSIPEYIPLTALKAFSDLGPAPRDYPVRVEPVLKGPALPQKFGIGGVVDIETFQIVVNKVLATARWNGALHHQNQAPGLLASDPRQGGAHLSQVWFASNRGWRTDGDQGYVAHAACEPFDLKKPQIAAVSCRGQILLKARFEKRYPPLPKRPDSPFIHVQPHDFMAGGGQSSGGHRAQASQSNDRYLHGFSLAGIGPFHALIESRNTLFTSAFIRTMA